MMINRIVQATNLLSYVDFNWDSVNLPNEDGNDVSSFKRRNIIFAENGNGKSNLIKMLVAMKVNGDIPKNWYLKTDPSKLIVSVDGEPNNIEYDCTGWKNNVLTKKVILFDAEFIDRYVHSTGKPATGAGNRDTERGKNIVYLGNFGSHNKDIEKLIEVKDALQRKTTALLNINTRAIQAIIPNTMKISDVCAAKVDIEAADSAKVDKNKLERSKLTEARGKLAKALKQEKEIAALQSLISHSIKPILKGTRVVGGEEEEYDLAVPTLFDFSVSEAVKKALAAVEHKQHFIKEGVGLLDSDPKHCPFCEQNIDGIALTDSYKEIFTEEFTDSEATIEKALRFYKELLGALRDVQQPSENAARLVEAKKYVSIETELNGIATTEAEKTLINDEVSRVDTKLAKTLDKVTGTNVSELQMVVERVKGEIDKYNTSVDAVNKAITKLKTDSSGGKIGERITELDVKIAQLEIDIIYAENQKELIKLIDECENLGKNTAVINSLEAVYQATKQEIVDQFKTWVEGHYVRIAELVKTLSPKMEVFDICGRSTFDRRNINSPAQCGFMVQVDGEDKMDALSEGERQVIALAYFFAMLEKMNNPEEMIVVLDDPITNFDAGKRKMTAHTIEKITKPFRQLFVFTCDPLFKTYLLKQITNERQLYSIFTSGGSSIHHIPNKYQTIISSFENDFISVDSVLGTDQDIVVYGQKLRFCLETKIREDYFGYSKDGLSEMMEQVAKNAGAKFNNLLAKKDDILEIYSYCNTGGLAHFPKDGSTTWNELKSMIKRYTALGI